MPWYRFSAPCIEPALAACVPKTATVRTSLDSKPATHWVFAYGSLIWRPDFSWQERVVADLTGWSRRFWQGSHDHRGTPDSPGRVVTLVQDAPATCRGIAYRIDDERIFAALDHREKNGYERRELSLDLVDGRRVIATTYVADPGNFAWFGDAPSVDIAQQIAMSHGPSGANVDYLRELARALAELDAVDAHVVELLSHIDSSPTPQSER